MNKVNLSNINNAFSITESEEALESLKSDLDLSQENFVLIGLNAKNNLVFSKTMFKGSINQTIIDFRLVLKEIIVNSCTGLIIGHNHPSGCLKPSKEDIEFTSRLVNACELFDIRVIDHLIFDSCNYVSMFDEGLI